MPNRLTRGKALFGAISGQFAGARQGLSIVTADTTLPPAIAARWWW
jgi:hypothetical protein